MGAFFAFWSAEKIFLKKGGKIGKKFGKGKVRRHEPSVNLENFMKLTASSLISSIGGTSGAIYGTAFMRMAKALKAGPADSLVKIGEVLQAGLDGAKMRGENTQVGDKTMIDALEPAVLAFKEKAAAGASIQEACAAATDAAKAGSDSTIDLIAKKGRASYLGERSIGHRDAGSYGIYVFAKAVAAYVAE